MKRKCSHIQAGMINAMNDTLVGMAIHSAGCCQPGGGGGNGCRGNICTAEAGSTEEATARPAAGPAKPPRPSRQLLMLNSLGAFAAATLPLGTAGARLFQAISTAEDNVCQQKICTSVFSFLCFFCIVNCKSSLIDFTLCPGKHPS